jgi:nuclear transport factor 2 (NTF2) superfamily protein
MNVSAPAHAEAAQTLTKAEAEALLAGYQKAWNTGDIDTFLTGFTDDIAVDFADLGKIEGKKALKAFILARLARQQGYQLKKTLRGVVGSTIVCSWTAEWTDSQTGKAMKGRGIEFIEIRDGLCAYWEAAFNGWTANEAHASLFV